MKTSIVFLSILSAVFAVKEIPADYSSRSQKTLTVIPSAANSHPLSWRLEFLNAAINCTLSIMPDMNGPHKNDNVILQSKNRCTDLVPGIDNLSTLKTDANGDITLYDKQGKKLARFIEAESGLHESIWPKYPLMTLAKLN